MSYFVLPSVMLITLADYYLGWGREGLLFYCGLLIVV